MDICLVKALIESSKIHIYEDLSEEKIEIIVTRKNPAQTIGYIKSLGSIHFSFYLNLQIFEYIIFKLLCT